MGTRSLTRIYNYDSFEPFVVMYKQYDGSPSAYGKDLCEFLRGMYIVNGISVDTPAKAANGAGCLAAQIVAHFKDGIGDIYLEHPSYPTDYVDYVYEVMAGEREIRIEIVRYGGECIFHGDVDEALDFCIERGVQ